jgi:hypothetical protein
MPVTGEDTSHAVAHHELPEVARGASKRVVGEADGMMGHDKDVFETRGIRVGEYTV